MDADVIPHVIVDVGVIVDVIAHVIVIVDVGVIVIPHVIVDVDHGRGPARGRGRSPVNDLTLVQKVSNR